MNYLLSIITFLPLVGAALVLLVSGDWTKKSIALGTTLVTLVISLLLWFGWDDADAGMQFVQNTPWVADLNLGYHLGWTASACCSCC